MALKGLDIFKLTPKTNCKDCGNPTCMAFAMKVASGALSIDKCPHMSAEALSTLSDEERQIIMLHVTAGLKHREIAQLLELPLSTVLSKYRRALSKLKQKLEGGDAR